MTDKEKLIKIKSLADKMYDTAFNLTTDASLLRKAMDDYHQFIINEYHKEEPVSEECIYNRTLEEKQKSCKFCSAACQVRIKEEPVSEELEEAAEGYAVTDEVLPNGKVMINFQVEKAFKAGAKWQKEQFEKNRLAHCDELTAEQAQIERDFVIEHLKENNRTPTFVDAIEYGMKVQEEKVMKDATEVTVHIEAGNYPYIPQMELYDYDKDVPLAKEGDKYKVVLIKED